MTENMKRILSTFERIAPRLSPKELDMLDAFTYGIALMTDRNTMTPPRAERPGA